MSSELLIRRRAMLAGNAAPETLPAEYESIDYVQCPYSSSFVTDVYAHGTQWDFDIDSVNNGTNQMFAAHLINGGCYVGVGGGKYWLGGGINSSSSCIGRQTPTVNFYSNKVVLNVNGETKERTSSSNTNNKVQLFQLNGSYKYVGKVYSVRCNGGALFNGVPAQRISDSVTGIYDFVSKKFYPKS